MKRLDVLVLKELLGPWIFGVSMFTMLLLAATYLGRIANYIVQGVPPNTVLQVTILLLPAILVQTFAMALLLGALLAFGRLSGDSEITAIRASGVSLYRIVAPVSAFSLVIACIAFMVNERLVPSAARQSAAIMSDLAGKPNNRKGQPIKHIEVQKGKVVAMFGATSFSLTDRSLRNVNVIAYDDKEEETYLLLADELEFSGLTNTTDPARIAKWRIRGHYSLESISPGAKFKIEGMDLWPDQIPQLMSSPDDIFAGQQTDMSIWNMQQIQERIKKAEETGNMTASQIRNLEYGYWNKIALPMAAFIFGTLGATLGIRNHRTGSATGFAISVAIIFSYFTLASFMNVFAQGGIFPPYVASFTPIAIGLIASGVIIWRRNR